MCANWALRSGCAVPSRRFTRRLQTVAQVVEHAADGCRADGPARRGQRRRELCATLARPPQGRRRVTACERIDQRLQGIPAVGLPPQVRASRTRAANAPDRWAAPRRALGMMRRCGRGGSAAGGRLGGTGSRWPAGSSANLTHPRGGQTPLGESSMKIQLRRDEVDRALRKVGPGLVKYCWLQAELTLGLGTAGSHLG